MKKYVLKKLQTEEQHVLPDEFYDGLNDRQKEAVTFGKGPLLVIAGAGSGKTKTLVHRVAKLVCEGVAPDRILLLTFTRKAAQEMIQRATQILDTRCQHIAGGTFHSFANVILRKYATHLGYDSNFTILDRSDAEDVMAVLRKDMLTKKDKRFPKKGTLISIVSKSLNTQIPVRQILQVEYPQYSDFSHEIEKLAEQYQRYKQAIQVMDYDDLLFKLRDLLAQHEAVRKELQERYLYIMVDEFQDTNVIQAEIVRLLAGSHGNVMVVGDDSQSIYSFRGANFKNIMNFPTLFPNAHVITLEQNYRSRQPILDMTNAVIERAREKYSKSLFTERGGTQKPVYIETESENAQSHFVCQKILELREEGVPLRDIAVLIRSGWHSNDLEVEFKAHQIPFTKVGGFKFVETAHVKDVVSFVRLIFNPKDRLSWSRVLMLLEGVGPKTASQLTDLILQNFPSGLADLSWLDRHGSKAYYQDLKQWLGIIRHYMGGGASPSKVMHDVLLFYKPIFQERYEDYTKRKSDLESLEVIAERFKSLEMFLTELSLEPPDHTQADAEAADKDDEKVVLSTIHSSKGLEWHSVFLISAVDGYLPSFQSLGDLSQLEEERRLLYVALTRAKQNLFIIKPHLNMPGQHGYPYMGMQFSKLTRFLDEGGIIQQYAERWAIVEDDNDIVPEEYAMESDPDVEPGPDFDLDPDPDMLDEPPASSEKKYFF